jgi:hypothetical protein
MKRDIGRVRIRGPGSREPRRKSVVAMRHRSFAQEQIMPTEAETKNRTFMQQLPAQRSDLILSCRDTEQLQRTFQIPWRGFALRPGCDPEAQSLSRGYDYFFFFEVFFATFLVAAFAVFFAFFAFLAMSSSLKKSGSVNMHTPSIDMHNIETISQMQN